MSYISDNIKFLRKLKGLTQQQLADELQIKRSLVGAYEEDRATPRIHVLQKLAGLFKVTIEELANSSIDFSLLNDKADMAKESISSSGSLLRVLPVIVDKNDEELIPIVPVKASAGYLTGLADPQFIGSLPRFTMPVPELSRSTTWRVFQVKGDSMLPVLPGSYLFCGYVESASSLKDGDICVIVTKDEGIVCKRIYLMEGGRLMLKSDNPEYDPYTVAGDDVMEIWKAKGVLSFEMPKPEKGEMSRISTILSEMKEEIRRLREQVNNG